jgi:hypothetical protein
MKLENPPRPEAGNPGGEYTIPHILDLIFKQLMYVSPVALIHFINGLFGTSHSADASVDYPSTETVSRSLRHLFSDTRIVIDGRHSYLIEVQSSSDAEMAIRVFEYGFAGGLHTKTVRGNIITVRFPEARVIYLNPAGRTPDELILRLEFPGGRYDYAVRSFKLFDHSIRELERKNLFLLLPFYVIKLRRAVKNARSSKQRNILAGQMNGLLEELMEAAGEGVHTGVLNESDWKQLTDHTERLLRAFYIGYTEFKETDDMLKDKILTYSQELVLQARKETQREDAKYYREQKKKVVERTVRKTRMEDEKRYQERERMSVRETAKKMKEMKIPARQIAAISGLPLSEIKKL